MKRNHVRMGIELVKPKSSELTKRFRGLLFKKKKMRMAFDAQAKIPA